MVAIGCTAAAILVGSSVVVLMLEARNLVVWSLKSVRAEVEETLPKELPAADRQRLDRAFAGALGRLREGELDPQAFKRLQGALLDFARSADSPSRDDVQALIEALERFAAGAVPDDRPEAPQPADETVAPPAEA